MRIRGRSVHGVATQDMHQMIASQSSQKQNVRTWARDKGRQCVRAHDDGAELSSSLSLLARGTRQYVKRP